MRLSSGILIAKKPAMHSHRSRIESAWRRAIAGDGCHYAGALVHGGESHLEHLRANPNGQQQKHKAGGVKVGEHGSAQLRHVLCAADVNPEPNCNDETARGKERGDVLHVGHFVP